MLSKKILGELHVFLETLIVAALSLLLPWKVCFRSLRFLTRYEFFQGDYARPAYDALKGCFPWVDQVQLRLIALHRLIDAADYFLTLKYRTRWLAKYCDVTGIKNKGLRSKACLFITFHYGQGFWALRYLNNEGFPLGWLHAPPPLRAPLGQKFAGWMGRRRIRQVARLCGAAPIPVGGSVARMRARLLEEGLPVMAMPDAPLQPGQSSLPVTFLGRPARIPAGTIRMAVQIGAPVVVYTMVVDPVDGRRHLRFEAPLQEPTAEALAQRLCDHLQSAIERDPTAWHVWPWADGFFDAPPEAASE